MFCPEGRRVGADDGPDLHIVDNMVTTTQK